MHELKSALWFGATLAIGSWSGLFLLPKLMPYLSGKVKWVSVKVKGMALAQARAHKDRRRVRVVRALLERSERR